MDDTSTMQTRKTREQDYDSQEVLVYTKSFKDLFSRSEWPLALDAYQRGFVWSPSKIRQMADDLLQYQEESTQGLPYYMGSILIHADQGKESRFIIDGQQRITALSVLYRIVTGKLPHGQALSYSAKSARNISKAHSALLASNAKNLLRSIFDRLIFTVITVNDADLAFTFFDTQNSRGVRLHATDLLKAYHLRAIDKDEEGNGKVPQLQEYCAARWEDIQGRKLGRASGQDFSINLFSKFLWRARRWRGQQAHDGGHESILEEFQNDTWPTGGNNQASIDTLPLYPSKHNKQADSLTLLPNGDRTLQGSTIQATTDPSAIPMAIRQPIHEGVGFFLYADKYAALLQTLLDEDTGNREQKVFKNVYDELVIKNQTYLVDAFLLSSLVYVDQFGFDLIPEFALRLEYLLGGIRLDKKQVRYETSANFFKNGDLNLLDIIVQSYHPLQTIQILQQRQSAYTDIYRKESVENGKGVQGRYKKANLSFYRIFGSENKTDLGDKHLWVDQAIKGLA